MKTIELIDEALKLIRDIDAVGKDGEEVTHPEHFALERSRQTRSLANKAAACLLDAKNSVTVQSTEDLADRLFKESCEKGEWNFTEQVGKETHSYINPSVCNNSKKIKEIALDLIDAILDPLSQRSVQIIKVCTQKLLIYCRAHNISLGC